MIHIGTLFQFVNQIPGELRMARALLGSPALDGGHPGGFLVTDLAFGEQNKKGWFNHER